MAFFGGFLFSTSVIAFIERPWVLFFVSGLFGLVSGLLPLGVFRKHPGRPIDEAAWYALTGQPPRWFESSRDPSADDKRI